MGLLTFLATKYEIRATEAKHPFANVTTRYESLAALWVRGGALTELPAVYHGRQAGKGRFAILEISRPAHS